MVALKVITTIFMAKKKTMEQMIEDLALMVGRGFAETQKDSAAIESRLTERLERIESKVTGLSGRVEVLEDQMRLVRTKLTL